MISEKKLVDIIKKDSLKIGFNNNIYLEDEYVLKVCYNESREDKFLREIEFYKTNDYSFMPRLIQFDTSKTIIPYQYIVISRVIGNNLFTVWSGLSDNEKISVLKQLRNIMHIFHKKDETGIDYKTVYFNEFDGYLTTIKNEKILLEKEIELLEEIRNKLYNNYYLHACYQIHGDLQFNNIIYLPDGRIKIIDFEHIQKAPIEKEYYQILRMFENPAAFKNNDNSNGIIIDSFKNYGDKAYTIFDEIEHNETAEYNIFMFDYLNAMRWIIKYPDSERYKNVLYEKVKQYGGIYERNN